MYAMYLGWQPQSSYSAATPAALQPTVRHPICYNPCSVFPISSSVSDGGRGGSSDVLGLRVDLGCPEFCTVGGCPASLMQIEAIAFSVDGCPGGCLLFEDNCEKVGSPTFPEDWVKEGSVRVALVILTCIQHFNQYQ